MSVEDLKDVLNEMKKDNKKEWEPEDKTKKCAFCGGTINWNGERAVSWSKRKYCNDTCANKAKREKRDEKKKREKTVKVVQQNQENVDCVDTLALHPSGIECITVAKYYNFCVGIALKSLWQFGIVNHDKKLECLEKAKKYIEIEIEKIKGAKNA